MEIPPDLANTRYHWQEGISYLCPFSTQNAFPAVPLCAGGEANRGKMRGSRFRCGHAFTDSNIIQRTGKLRCRICTKRADDRSNYNAKVRMLAVQPCLLATL